MGYIVGKQRVRDSLYVLLQHAQEAGEITKKRREYLLKQCEQLAQELVLLLNHKQSTSLSMADHKRILNTISYVVLQGLEEMEERSLQELEIDACFERGLLVLQNKEQQTRNLLNQLRRNRLPFCNERYNSVMDEQIPHYLEQLSTYEGILYYSHTTEDLDYPLVDGIPLFHDMYHLDGMDLVLYYMERFALEHTFCEYFREELPVPLSSGSRLAPRVHSSDDQHRALFRIYNQFPFPITDLLREYPDSYRGSLQEILPCSAESCHAVHMYSVYGFHRRSVRGQRFW